MWYKFFGPNCPSKNENHYLRENKTQNTLNSCFISNGIKSKFAFKQRMECNNIRRYSII
jgi:hypothetical protein